MSIFYVVLPPGAVMLQEVNMILISKCEALTGETNVNILSVLFCNSVLNACM